MCSIFVYTYVYASKVATLLPATLPLVRYVLRYIDVLDGLLVLNGAIKINDQ